MRFLKSDWSLGPLPASCSTTTTVAAGSPHAAIACSAAAGAARPRAAAATEASGLPCRKLGGLEPSIGIAP
eukprot:scaffold12935_cov85-Phaeocystis_antarctica.AAC.4